MTAGVKPTCSQPIPGSCTAPHLLQRASKFKHPGRSLGRLRSKEFRLKASDAAVEKSINRERLEPHEASLPHLERLHPYDLTLGEGELSAVQKYASIRPEDQYEVWSEDLNCYYLAD